MTRDLQWLEDMAEAEHAAVAGEQWEMAHRIRPSAPMQPLVIFPRDGYWECGTRGSLMDHIRARSVVGRFHQITMTRRYREAEYRARGRRIGAKSVAAAVGRQIMDQAIASLRFWPCPCGNEQPFVAGRGKPDCESCGRSAPP